MTANQIPVQANAYIFCDLKQFANIITKLGCIVFFVCFFIQGTHIIFLQLMYHFPTSSSYVWLYVSIVNFWQSQLLGGNEIHNQTPLSNQ